MSCGNRLNGCLLLLLYSSSRSWFSLPSEHGVYRWNWTLNLCTHWKSSLTSLGESPWSNVILSLGEIGYLTFWACPKSLRLRSLKLLIFLVKHRWNLDIFKLLSVPDFRQIPHREAVFEVRSHWALVQYQCNTSSKRLWTHQEPILPFSWALRLHPRGVDSMIYC